MTNAQLKNLGITKEIVGNETFYSKGDLWVEVVHGRHDLYRRDRSEDGDGAIHIDSFPILDIAIQALIKLG